VKSLFLTILFKQNKLLFAFVVIFLAGTIYVNLVSKSEKAPIFLWAMFSQKEWPKPIYTAYEISIDDKPFDYTSGVTSHKRHCLITPLDKFLNEDSTIAFISNDNKAGFNQPIIESFTATVKQKKAFADWFKRKNQVSNNSVIQINKIESRFDYVNSIEKIQSKEIITF